MRRIAIGIMVIVCILTLMFAEYRYIMWNICPYSNEGGKVCLEIFGHVDEYYADPMEKMEE